MAILDDLKAQAGAPEYNSYAFDPRPLFREAADEIEQLRADLDLRNQTALDRKKAIVELEAEIERLRAALADCVALVRGDISGPEQVAGILKDAETLMSKNSPYKLVENFDKAPVEDGSG